MRQQTNQRLKSLGRQLREFRERITPTIRALLAASLPFPSALLLYFWRNKTRARLPAQRAQGHSNGAISSPDGVPQRTGGRLQGGDINLFSAKKTKAELMFSPVAELPPCAPDVVRHVVGHDTTTEQGKRRACRLNTGGKHLRTNHAGPIAVSETQKDKVTDGPLLPIRRTLQAITRNTVDMSRHRRGSWLHELQNPVLLSPLDLETKIDEVGGRIKSPLRP